MMRIAKFALTYVSLAFVVCGLTARQTTEISIGNGLSRDSIVLLGFIRCLVTYRPLNYSMYLPVSGWKLIKNDSFFCHTTICGPFYEGLNDVCLIDRWLVGIAWPQSQKVKTLADALLFLKDGDFVSLRELSQSVSNECLYFDGVNK
jgi:hypothetical protein